MLICKTHRCAIPDPRGISDQGQKRKGSERELNHLNQIIWECVWKIWHQRIAINQRVIQCYRRLPQTDLPILNRWISNHFIPRIPCQFLNFTKWRIGSLISSHLIITIEWQSKNRWIDKLLFRFQNLSLWSESVGLLEVCGNPPAPLRFHERYVWKLL
jgi:hypothetical protein